jgi:nucleoside-diphosphate-sugar epimerase
MKTLISGGAGFLGGHLGAHLLQSGYEVVLVDDFSRGVRDPFLEALAADERCQLVEADLLDPSSTTGLPLDVDVVVHLAAIIGVRHVMERPYSVLADNVEMHTRMIEYARRVTRLRQFVFASTSEVYAGTLRHHGLTIPTPEATPLTVASVSEPRGTYMLSKIYGEALCHHSGLPFVIVRPHNAYGERMGLSHVIPELLRKAHFLEKGGEIEVFSVEHQRAFCHVSDAVEMLRRILESGVSGLTFNLGNEAAEVSIGEVANTIVEVVGKEVTIKPGPVTEGSPARRCPSMRLMEEVTGFRAQVGLREGIERTYRWYRTNIFEGDGVGAL